MRIRALTVGDYDALVRLWQEGGLPYRPDGRDQREWSVGWDLHV